MSSIDLRPSDVWLAASRSLQQGAQAADSIYSHMYEAERVSQVNSGLTYLETAYDNYRKDLSQRSFDSKIEAGPNYQGPEGATVVKQFGDASLTDIEADQARFFESQLKYITETTTNRAAREEMIQHLQMMNLQNKQQIRTQWETAADHAAMAGLQQLRDTVLAGNDPWEVKVAKITNRVNQMVQAGRLWKDDGEQIIAQATQAAQYSYASNAAMAVMKAERNADAGERWLNENTPFWDGDPDKRAQVLQDVRQEFNIYRQEQDNKLDGTYSDMHLDMEITGTEDLQTAIMQAKAALASLTTTDFYNRDTKYAWEQRFLSSLERFQRLATDPDGAKALEDAQKLNESQLEGELTLSIREGKITPEDALKIIRERFDAHDVRGSWVRSFSKDIEAEDDPYFNAGLDYINDKLKGKDEQRFKAVTDFRAAYQFQPNLTREQSIQLAQNIADPASMRATADLVRNALLALGVNDQNIFTDLERNHADVEAGRYTGVALLPDRRDALSLQAQKELEFAKKTYPELNLQTALVDFDGQWTGRAGLPRFIDADGKVYAFKLENQAFVLYGLNDDGTWQNVGRRASDQPAAQSTAPRPVETGGVSDTTKVPGMSPNVVIGLVNLDGVWYERREGGWFKQSTGERVGDIAITSRLVNEPMTEPPQRTVPTVLHDRPRGSTP